MVQLNKQFDISGPTGGFHITGHLLALVGLIVACFAITGYITFRNNSVPYKALDLNDYEIEADKVGPGVPKQLISHLSPNLKTTDPNDFFVGRLPAGAFINNVNMLVVVPATGDVGNTDLGFAVGKVKAGEEIVTMDGDGLMADGTADPVGTRDSRNVEADGKYDDDSREVWVKFAVGTADLKAAGEYVLQVAYTVV